MIEIGLLSGEERALSLAELAGGFEGEAMVYAAREGGRRLGRCAFSPRGGGPDGKGGMLLAVKMDGPGEAPIADGLIRSAVCLLLDRGVVSIAAAPGAADERLLRAVGFTRDSAGSLTLNERTFAGGCCSQGAVDKQRKQR